MTFNSIEELKEIGFQGFKKMSELFDDSSMIPREKGIYLVINTSLVTEFLPIGTGGFFKGKDPNVTINELKENWVDETIVVYIGKAGGVNVKATLQSRLKQYLDFGQRRNVGHFGGRLIWQMSNSKDLIVCWKVIENKEPSEIESDLIKNFVSIYGKRPFANLKG